MWSILAMSTPTMAPISAHEKDQIYAATVFAVSRDQSIPLVFALDFEVQASAWNTHYATMRGSFGYPY